MDGGSTSEKKKKPEKGEEATEKIYFIRGIRKAIWD
jgi:hypothetical protein